MTKVVHCKKEPYDIYIGRGKQEVEILGFKLGNHFTHIKDKHTLATYIVETREEAIRLHKECFLHQPNFIEILKQLKGKTLGCWCAPLSCHGDTYKELIEEYLPND